MPTVQISETSFDYLKGHAEPLVDTTSTVLDRIIEEHKIFKKMPTTNKTELQVVFGADDLPSVKHASVVYSRVSGKPVTKKKWNHTLSELIATSISKGNSQDDIRQILEANVIVGEPDDEEKRKGYKYGPKNADFVFQGLDAERACKNIVLLANKFTIPVEIEFRWDHNAKATFANKTAKLVLP